jgi:tetraacyldisaccharide 4'-kinase
VFLLDDGFQHLQLARDVDILLMDTTRPLQGASLLPAGMLREPLTAMGRADVVVFTRVEAQPGIAAAVAKLRGYPVFTATTKLVGFRQLRSASALLSVDEIGDGPFLAFCGLGNPQQFFRDVGSWGLAVTGEEIFPDHHQYSAGDVERITSAARRSGARALVTTEKDAKNLLGMPVEGLPVYVAVIELEMAQEEEFLALMLGKIAERRGGAA